MCGVRCQLTGTIKKYLDTSLGRFRFCYLQPLRDERLDSGCRRRPCHPAGKCALTSAWALQPLGDIPSPEAWPCPLRAVAEIRSVIAGIVASLAELRANAETARATAGRLRDAALAAGSNPLLVSAAYDTLLATIDQIEARKTVAFETELVAGDAVLEATEAELSAIGELASGSSNEDLIRLRDTLAPRLDALFETLGGFPSGPVDEATVLVVPACSGSPDGTLGTVLSRLAPPGDVIVALPHARRILPGTRVCVELTLPFSDALGVDGGADRIVNTLLSRTSARASLTLPCGNRVPIAASTSPLRSGDLCGVTMSFLVPADAALGSSFVIDSVTVARQPAGGTDDASRLPYALSVVERLGISAPFTLKGIARDYQTPCVSQDGRVFVARGREGVSVFNEQGEFLETLSTAPLASPCTAAYVESSGVLLVRDSDYDSTDITALDIRSSARPPRLVWTHSIPRFHGSSTGKLGPGGLVVLPELGIAVYPAYFAHCERVSVPVLALPVPLSHILHLTRCSARRHQSIGRGRHSISQSPPPALRGSRPAGIGDSLRFVRRRGQGARRSL